MKNFQRQKMSDYSQTSSVGKLELKNDGFEHFEWLIFRQSYKYGRKIITLSFIQTLLSRPRNNIDSRHS